MPSSRRDPIAGQTFTERNVRALLYGLHSNIPFAVSIPTAFYQNEGSRPQHLPLVEIALGTRLFIHDCAMDLVTSGDIHRFQIFFTRHRHQPRNRSIDRIFPEGSWEGQILIMKVGKRREASVINLRSGDRALATAAVVKFMKYLSNHNLRQLPQGLRMHHHLTGLSKRKLVKHVEED